MSELNIQPQWSRQKIPISNIRRGDSTTVSLDIQKIMREYYEQFYAHKFNNTDEMDKFLERHKPSKLTQEEIDNWINCLPIFKNIFIGV